MGLHDYLNEEKRSTLEDNIALVSSGAAAGLAVSKATNLDKKTGVIIGIGVCLLSAYLINRFK